MLRRQVSELLLEARGEIGRGGEAYLVAYLGDAQLSLLKKLERLVEADASDKLLDTLARHRLHLRVERRTAHEHLAGKEIGGEMLVGDMCLGNAHRLGDPLLVDRGRGDLLRLDDRRLLEAADHQLAAAQDVLDLLPDEHHGERLGDIVLGTDLQTFELLLDVDLCRQNDERNVAGHDVGLNSLAELDAVHQRHHHIGEDEVYLLAFLLPACDLLQTILAVGGFHDGIFVLQRVAEVASDLCVVLNYQDRRMLVVLSGSRRVGTFSNIALRPIVLCLAAHRFFVVDIILLQLVLFYFLFCRNLLGLVAVGERGQRDGEAAALPQPALNLQHAVVHLDEPADDRQAYTAALMLVVHLIEPFQNVLLVLFGDADAGVGDGEAQLLR